MRTLSDHELNHISGSGFSTFDKGLIGAAAVIVAVGVIGFEVFIMYQSGTSFSLLNGAGLVMAGGIAAIIGASMVVGFSALKEGAVYFFS